MFIKTITDPLEIRRDTISLDIAKNYLYEKRIAQGDAPLVTAEIIENLDNWLRLPAYFLIKECTIPLHKMIWDSIWLSN